MLGFGHTRNPIQKKKKKKKEKKSEERKKNPPKSNIATKSPIY